MHTDSDRRLSVRVIPELRAAHLARHVWDPTEIVLYRHTNPDLREAMPDYCRQVTLWSVARTLRHLRPTVVELPEPLWLRALPLTAVAGAAARIVPGARPLVVSYCIENSELSTLMSYRGRSLRWALTKPLAAMVALLFDRLAYGTPDAQRTYAALTRGARPRTRLFLELAAPAARSASGSASDALFVGRLEHRKGIHELLAAWEAIEARCHASITVIGDGPERAAVQEWAERNPTRRTYRRHVPHIELPEIYANHRVLAAPSVRDGRWREQVGLPIKEALQHGLTVVTTRETGLAAWLDDQGHVVIEYVSQLAEAMLSALQAPLDPQVVRRALPVVDGRRVAHDWLRE